MSHRNNTTEPRWLSRLVRQLDGDGKGPRRERGRDRQRGERGKRRPAGDGEQAGAYTLETRRPWLRVFRADAPRSAHTGL